jgi:hypothetical protein
LWHITQLFVRKGLTVASKALDTGALGAGAAAAAPMRVSESKDKATARPPEIVGRARRKAARLVQGSLAPRFERPGEFYIER